MEYSTDTTGSLIWLVVYGLIIIVPAWRIFKRAGFSPALALLVFIPAVGALIATLILAFARWPNSRDA